MFKLDRRSYPCRYICPMSENPDPNPQTRSPAIWPSDNCVLRFALDETHRDEVHIRAALRKHAVPIVDLLRSKLPDVLDVRMQPADEAVGGTVTESITVSHGRWIGASVNLVWCDHIDRLAIEVYVDEESPIIEKARLARVALWVGGLAATGACAAWFTEGSIGTAAAIGAILGLVVAGVINATRPNQLGLPNEIASTNEGLVGAIRKHLLDAYRDNAMT